VNVSPLRRQASTITACWPGFSFRHRDPIPAVTADDPGHEGEDLAGQRQRGAAEKQLEPLVLGADFRGLPQLPDAIRMRDTPHRHQTMTHLPRSG
jgi:hypothetical protein